MLLRIKLQFKQTLLFLIFVGLIYMFFVNPQSIFAFGLAELPYPSENINTAHSFYLNDGDTAKQYVTQGKYMWHYICKTVPNSNPPTRECKAVYVTTLADHFSTLLDKETNWTIPPPTDTLNTFHAFYLTDNITLKAYFTKGDRIWHYICKPEGNPTVNTCRAQYTQTLSEHFASLLNKERWDPPAPMQNLDTFRSFNKPGTQEYHAYFTQGPYIWKYLCAPNAQGVNECSAQFVQSLSQNLSTVNINNQSVWNPSVPTSDLDAFYTFYLPDGVTQKNYIVKGDRIWHFICNPTCSALYTKTLTESVTEVTNKDIWSPSIPTIGNLSFSLQNGRQTARLDGTWYLSRLDPMQMLPISVPGYWKSDFWNLYGFRKVTYTNVFYDLIPYDAIDGPVWYAFKFNIPQAAIGKTMTVYFKAVAAKAEVYINGEYVGTHLGVNDPFSFQIDDKLWLNKNNILSLKVTESTPFEAGRAVYGSTLIPIAHYHRNVGGVWQPVEVHLSDGAYIASAQATTPETNSATFTVQLVARQSDTYTLVAQVTDPTNNQVKATSSFPQPIALAPGQSISVSWNSGTIASLTPWSPENPKLYTLTFTLKRATTIVDTISKTIGFRKISTGTVSVNGQQVGKVFLNNQPYFLKGVGSNIHIPVPNDLNIATQVLTLIKQAGANSVRFWTFPSQIWLDEADRIGLLSIVVFGIDGIHMNLIQPPAPDPYTDPALLAETKTEYKHMITSIMTHPSVAIYELGNENVFANHGNIGAIVQFFNSILADIKTTDPTRLYLTDAGCETYEFNGVFVPDYCGNGDFTDTHWYDFWYSCFSCTNEQISARMDNLLATAPTKPHLFTEFGGAYTDDQGNFVGAFPGIDFHHQQALYPDWTIPVRPVDSNPSINTIGTNPVRPTAALNKQAEIIQRWGTIFKSKKDTSRLSGIIYWAFDHILYNPYNLPWNKLKTWYYDSYNNPAATNAPYIGNSTWTNHATLEVKPAYQALKAIYTDLSTPATPPPTPIPSPSYTIPDLKQLLVNYLSTQDSQYFPQENKINMLDGGYVVKWLQ